MRIHSILSRCTNWPCHTCSSTSCSINCRKWVQCSMHCRNGFSIFQDGNSWIVGQVSRYITKEAPLIILDRKSDVCMDRNVKNSHHTSHISRRVNFVRNSENWKIHKIDWCEGGLKLADISTKVVGENYLNLRIKYIMVRLDNWDRTLVQEGWQHTW